MMHGEPVMCALGWGDEGLGVGLAAGQVARAAPCEHDASRHVWANSVAPARHYCSGEPT